MLFDGHSMRYSASNKDLACVYLPCGRVIETPCHSALATPRAAWELLYEAMPMDGPCSSTQRRTHSLEVTVLVRDLFWAHDQQYRPPAQTIDSTGFRPPLSQVPLACAVGAWDSGCPEAS